MHNKSWFLSVCLGLLGLLVGGAVMGVAFRNPAHIPPLKVTGDVANVLNLQDPERLGKLEKVTCQGTRYQAVKLADIITKASPLANAGQLYLVGLDGFTSAIKAADIDDCYIAFTAKNGWEAVNLAHPNSSNVKFLTEIVVVSDGGSKYFAFNVINPDTDLVQITPGQLLAGPLTLYPYAEGKAVVQNGGKDYEAQVFTRRRVFRISDLTPLQDGDTLLVMDEKGEYRLVDDGGYFEVRDNYINYLQPDTRTKLEKVKGVIVHPPATSITDAYYDAQHYLESGDKLLMVVLDGLTYQQYSYAFANGYAPFLKNAGKAVQAWGVYPVENNVGLAALLTGKAPQENGVITDQDRELKAPSIYAEVNMLNKKAVFLDAAENGLDTEIQPVSIHDKNADGSADDELFEATLDTLEQGYDLLTVRFHGIDDAGQRYGPLARETMQSISATDKYLSEIVSRWPGKVIITGTQGSGAGESAGSQEVFKNEVMFVPYLRLR
ncbi:MULTISPECIES: alkaline phosphatase family protein [Pelotomaculum]|nr:MULTISPECIES: alkaline phosphatase family protein [Pelotomaculum]